MFGIHFREEGKGEKSVTRKGTRVHRPLLSNKGKHCLYNQWSSVQTTLQRTDCMLFEVMDASLFEHFFLILLATWSQVMNTSPFKLKVMVQQYHSFGAVMFQGEPVNGSPIFTIF